MASSLQSRMQSLLNCVCTALGGVGWVGDCCLEPGNVAWDQCGCDSEDGGGKAWAVLARVYPSKPYPSNGPPADMTRSDVVLTAVVELGAITCVCPGCDCESKAADAEKLIDMELAMIEAVACCAADSCGEDIRYSGSETMGPNGLCGGVKMTVTMPLTVCCPPT